MKKASHRIDKNKSFQDFFTYHPEMYNCGLDNHSYITDSIHGTNGGTNIIDRLPFSVDPPIFDGENYPDDEDAGSTGDGNRCGGDDDVYDDRDHVEETITIQENDGGRHLNDRYRDFNAMENGANFEYSLNQIRRKNSDSDNSYDDYLKYHSDTEDFTTCEAVQNCDADHGRADDCNRGDFIDDDDDFVCYADSEKHHQIACHGEGQIYRYNYSEEDVPQDHPHSRHREQRQRVFSSEENEEEFDSVLDDDDCQETDIRDGIYCRSFAIDESNKNQDEVIGNLEFDSYDGGFDEVEECAGVHREDEGMPLQLVGVSDLREIDNGVTEDDRHRITRHRSPFHANSVYSNGCKDDFSLSDESKFEPTNQTSTRDGENVGGETRHLQTSDRTIEPIQNRCNIQTSKFLYSPLDVIQRIEAVMTSLIDYLDQNKAPILKSFVETRSNNIIRAEDDNDSDASDEPHSRPRNYRTHLSKTNANVNPTFQRSFGNISQTRSFTSVVLVMSFVHQLLLSNRTTTTREVYYVFVTHFRSQRECDSAILDVAKILDVPRRALGLSASPKGMMAN